MKRYGRPFSVRIIARRQGNDPFGSGQPSSPQLFQKLDEDQDGLLSAGEFSLSTSLRKLDLDDDETLSRNELAPVSNPYGEVRLTSGGRRAPTITPFVYLGGATGPRQIVRDLLQRYDQEPKDGQLNRSEMGFDEQSFARFDADENGHLDGDELNRFVRRPTPQIQVVARMGSADQPVVEVTSSRKEQNSKTGPPDSSASMVLGKLHLKFNVSNGMFSVDMDQFYQQQFAFLDGDKNGYLDPEESERQPPIRNAFESMDADKDQKVFKKEYIAYFEELATAARSRATVTVAEQGNQLFRHTRPESGWASLAARDPPWKTAHQGMGRESRRSRRHRRDPTPMATVNRSRIHQHRFRAARSRAGRWRAGIDERSLLVPKDGPQP